MSSNTNKKIAKPKFSLTINDQHNDKNLPASHNIGFIS